MNNPQAFPGPGAEAGMTLRDYFAGQALAGVCALPDADGLNKAATKAGMSVQGLIAVTVYRIADAMLAEREKKGQP